ncbi:hypothetical protein J6590_100623 [Homalodisca vitripennis]|nr:hypothetical protein J6590_100623 [Homalodisca vitripennis]
MGFLPCFLRTQFPLISHDILIVKLERCENKSSGLNIAKGQLSPDSISERQTWRKSNTAPVLPNHYCRIRLLALSRQPLEVMRKTVRRESDDRTGGVFSRFKSNPPEE